MPSKQPQDEACRSSLQIFEGRLETLERRNRLLVRAVILLVAIPVLVLLANAEFGSRASADSSADATEELRTHQLVIVDDKGIVRARIGANLPDAIIDGKQVGRGGEKVSGIILYDGTGQERGGYLTFEPSGNVGLTLDSRKAQTTMLIADPDGASALQMWARNSSIDLRSDEDGSRLTSTSKGALVEQVPPLLSMTSGTCLAYKEALTRVSPAQVTKDCGRRFPSATCEKCLGTSD